MSDASEKLRAAFNQAVVDISQLKAQLAALEGERREPIAIVGIGCRYPGGVSDPESFWRLLDQGIDVMAKVPAERWDVEALYDPDPDAAGKMVTRVGGFLRDVDKFDADFFGISPREATKVDPQQRLLLETSWEALERAAIAPDRLVGTSTGVFVGLVNQEYASLGGDTLEKLDGYVGTGSYASVASGRISYLLGLQGPSMTLDTACSSSLVAAHLACQSLRLGECSLALAGGVALVLLPTTFVETSKLRALSPDGRCKTFSAAANGVGWSEGCGMLVLERLSDARRNGHPVLAIIRGSAVNQDGRSNGLTAPNGPSQEALLRSALAHARVSPADVQYVECHGTGTPLGDPIEVQALGRALAEGRDPKRPVLLGSVKSNLGHTIAAAGVAGIIKVVTALQHGRIPKNLHFDAPNPHIPWDELPVKVVSDAIDWLPNGPPRIAGVSSFGISGTNAHVVLEEAPRELEGAWAPPDRAAELIVLSAKSAAALSQAVTELGRHLSAHPEPSLGDIAYSLATSRMHHDHRAAFVARSRDELQRALDAWRSEAPPEAWSLGEVRAKRGKVVFVFPGQGSQWVGMGRELLETEPAFRASMHACDLAIAREAGWSLLEELHAPPEKSRLDRLDVVQPMLFAMATSLAALWRSWGVEPSAVVGHSQGEVAAAHVAGALTLAEAAQVICRRSRLLMRLSGKGEMAMVQLSPVEAQEAIRGHEQALAIAATNSRRSTVLSGAPSAMAVVLAELAAKGVFCKRVRASAAGHSSQVDPILGEVVSLLAGLSPKAPLVPMRSTVTGALVAGGELTGSYWANNLRMPVRFAGVIEQVSADGYGPFVEMSAHPVLLPALEELVDDGGVAAGPVVGSLVRGEPERASLLASLGKLFVAGSWQDFRKLLSDGGRRVELPTYPWQRTRYWVESSAIRSHRVENADHPMLGARVHLADTVAVYEAVLSVQEHAWLRDHCVAGQAVVPGAALAELVLAAAEHRSEGEAVQVHSLVMQTLLALPEQQDQRVQVVLTEQDSGLLATISSQPANARAGAPWTLHATAEARSATLAPPARLDVGAVRNRCPEPVDVSHTYDAFERLGARFGATFRGMKTLHRSAREAVADVALPEGTRADGYGLHPALLDAALQAFAGLVPQDCPYVPVVFGMTRLTVHAPGATSGVAHVRLASSDGPAESILAGDLTLVDPLGGAIAEATGVQFIRADARSLHQAALGAAEGAAASSDRAIFRLDWTAVAVAAQRALPSGRWIVVAAEGDHGAEALAKRIRAAGRECTQVAFRELGALRAEHVVCVWGARHAEAPTAAIEVASEGLALAQRLANDATSANVGASRLWWVTTGAVAVTPEESPDTALASVWGLGRTVMKEHPELGCTLVDLQPVAHAADAADAIFRELSLGDDEREVAWRGEKRHVARLVRASSAAVPSAENYALTSTSTGMLQGLALLAAQRRPPGPGEVEIAVRAAGLNFHDVLDVLGVLPPSTPLGGECAGVVSRVGPGVVNVVEGDRVMALATGSFQRWVTVDARMVAPIPEGLSFEQGATTPVVFLTAWYALHDLGHIAPGERLLVHAGAGGVGMAAIQLARAAGADVLATASPSKWDTVRALGVTQVASSRDLSFAPAVRAATHGKPVDVVLNSLARELVDASLGLLSEGGRFIDMSKTDIRDPATVRAAHPGVTYRAFDLTTVAPERIAEMLAQIGKGFASGALRALPVRAFPITAAENAFRYMAQARHVGKLALVPPSQLRTDGAVLITGGLGGLGTEVARRLARRGIKHLVLTGRRGEDTPGAERAVAELEALGATVTVAATDVADRAALAQVLARIRTERPLRGVIHAAVVLDDGMLAAQTPDRFARVMRPKIAGAYHLDALTRQDDLDFFVLFSSIAGTLGSQGQCAYAAANASLDALAARRRAQGLPAQSLAWGPWAEVGGAAALNATLQSRLTRQGWRSFAPAEGVALFESVLGRPEATLVLLHLDLRAARKSFGRTVPPVWRALVRAPSTAAAATQLTWTEELAALPHDRRIDAVLEVVRLEIARGLGLPGPDAAPADQPLLELGLDSLMAIQLRNALSRRAGIKLPATLAFNHPTPMAITRFLLEKVLPGTR
jgi:epothilone polyketide synthase D